MTKIVSESAYPIIKEYLLSSEVYPGQKILHLDLGKRLGISQTPLREALFRLSAEGLLTHHNQRGFFIPEISLREAKELYETIGVIEPYLVERATISLPNSQLAVLRGIVKEYKDLVQGPYTHKRLLVDKRFHMEIVKYGNNETLTQILERVYDRAIIKRRGGYLSPIRGPMAYREHWEVLKALEARDAKKARRLMEIHIRNGTDFVISDIERRQNKELATLSLINSSDKKATDRISGVSQTPR
jgi:DNA-binding GntR family transcriptional regulator